MAKVLIEETNLTNIANAIREKTGKSDLITPPNMASEIESIEVGGGGDESDTIIDYITGETTEVKSNIKTVRNRAFYYGGLTKLELPLATTIGEEAFARSSLTAISIPSVKVIGKEAFDSCYDLVINKFPDTVEELGASAFTNINTASLISNLPPNLKIIGGNIMSGGKFANPLVIPSTVESIGAGAFSHSSITTITFKGKPNTIDVKACQYNSKLTTINVPWAEGEVANAPWGATNATINYNYNG